MESIHIESLAIMIDPSSELLFVRLREIFDMEKQLGESLPTFSGITGDGELRELIRGLSSRAVGRTAGLLAIFVSHRVSPGTCVSDQLKDRISGANMRLADMEESSTRDLLIAAHCLRIGHDGVTAYEEAASLARTAGFGPEWEVLANLYVEQQDAVDCLDRIGTRLFNRQARTPRRRRKVA